MVAKKQSLASAFHSLLRYRLLLPITLAVFFTLAGVSYFAGKVLQSQQERFNISVSYSTEAFIEHAAQELDAMAFTLPDSSLEEKIG